MKTMLVLIATNDLQGTVDSDYAWTVEGELVTPVATECASGERCGCNRGFPGLASGFATTTAMVVNRPGVTEADLRDAVYDWLDRGGWIDLLEQTAVDRASATGHDGYLAIDEYDDIDTMVDSIIAEHLDMIHEVCSSFPEGTVVVRRGPLVAARSHPFAA
jgi:hypothetical protein